MKLSNKILIGFFACIFVYMTAVFAEIRLKGTPNILNATNSIVEEVKLSGDISYIIIDGMKRRVHITSDERPRLEVRSFKGNVLATINYQVSGDTLTLSDVEPAQEVPNKITLFLPSTSLKGISINDSEASLERVQQTHLSISQKRARTWMHDSQIGQIVLHATAKSRMEVHSSTLDMLSANFQSSEVHLYSSVRSLDGSMENNSFLHVINVNSIQFRKDDSSRLHCTTR